MPGLFLGRQPIFDRELRVFGYEIRSHLVQSQTEPVINDDLTTTHATLEKIFEVGLNTLVGGHWAFIRFTHRFFSGEFSLPFLSDRLILEIHDDNPFDEDFENALGTLEKRGYQIALDDSLSYETIANLVRDNWFVRINIGQLIRPEIGWIIAQFKNKNVKLLAENVQTLDDFEFCKRLGFEYFQGIFLRKPNLLSGRKIDTSRVTVLQALAVTANENSDFPQLEKIISRDITLSYKLLRLVNSVYYGSTDTVKSLQQAIAMIGLDQLRSWITLILMSTVDDKQEELTSFAIIRAKMCELLARSMGSENREEFFLIGLLSIVDALMDLPMEEVINNLSLSKEFVDGLLHQKGILGKVLNIVQLYENGDWDKLIEIEINPQTLCEAYINSIRWSNTIVNSMNE